MGSRWCIPKPSFWTSLPELPASFLTTPALTPRTLFPCCSSLRGGLVRQESGLTVCFLGTPGRPLRRVSGTSPAGFVTAARAWNESGLISQAVHHSVQTLAS